MDETEGLATLDELATESRFGERLGALAKQAAHRNRSLNGAALPGDHPPLRAPRAKRKASPA